MEGMGSRNLACWCGAEPGEEQWANTDKKEHPQLLWVPKVLNENVFFLTTTFIPPTKNWSNDFGWCRGFLSLIFRSLILWFSRWHFRCWSLFDHLHCSLMWWVTISPLASQQLMALGTLAALHRKSWSWPWQISSDQRIKQVRNMHKLKWNVCIVNIKSDLPKAKKICSCSFWMFLIASYTFFNDLS